MNQDRKVCWDENGETCCAHWHSESAAPPPKRVVAVDDAIKADAAYRLACEGTALLWRGDFHNARLLLQALARRTERSLAKGRVAEDSPAAAFHRQRLAQSQRARTLGMLLIPFEADHGVPLRRAPDVHQACLEAFGPMEEPYLASLRDLLGAVGAHEWRKKGVEIAALGARIHPHYGVFSPVRGEYLDLMAKAPLPSLDLAFDIGTGTGVLAAILARRGVARVVATDLNPRALACARENIARLGLSEQVEVVAADLFPPGRAPLILCNPPWVPARPKSPLEQAVYDPDSAMLRGFLAGLGEHLSPEGEGWLILSDIAERLGLRSREALQGMFAEAGLEVVARLDTRPTHRRAADRDDPLHAARAAEVTSLWRLRRR
ncbi:methyltransferase [Geoalkalibacter halelectricus]|uniref:methyltransferase n=1 Tax=Geoalkalibacter halelectricus TaxID=2847045 RepID=UPI003D20B39A